jgi:CTP:molybdopterin cytidylyltransferase MocA
LDIAGDVGCRRIIKRHPEKVFAVQMETDHVVRDVDTPEDFLRVRGEERIHHRDTEIAKGAE